LPELHDETLSVLRVELQYKYHALQDARILMKSSTFYTQWAVLIKFLALLRPTRWLARANNHNLYL